ncbi:hypothetical protein LXA43DRAFT_590107 [Ganoderma leucocontextum]|nr:hypothetical protein LXA43DRAFT_590107 [Ganoderma leucocontextum]
MSHPGPGVCRFYGTTNGCRYGNRCRYSHDLREPTTSRGSSSPSGPSSSGGWRSRQLQASTSSSSPTSYSSRGGFKPRGIPNNTCKFFWENGSCNRGFECTFRHVKGTATTDAQEATAAQRGDDDEDEGPIDFFSPGGLAAGAGSVLDDRHNLTPSEVHNHLKDFLRDDYRFESAAQVQGFVRVLASVSDSNKAWNTENAQEFLGAVVKGNSLLRIADILRFELVDVAIGSNTGVLSFQRGYFPVFQFVASDLVLKSTLHRNINLLYAVIKNNHAAIFTTLLNCLQKMMKDASWKDPTPRLAAFYQNNLGGIVVFRTLSTVLLQYFNRYKDAIRTNTNVPAFINQLADWFKTWADDVSAFPPRFDDPISSVPSNNRKLLINHIRDDIDRLISIVERETGVVRRLRQGPSISTVTDAQRSQARVAQLAQTYDPPGLLHQDGPRHDNDFMDIERIRIAPTHDELLCAVPPYLPVFSRDAPHHWPPDSMQRHLDIQFRLLREELISTTRTSLTVVHDDLLKMWSGSRKTDDKTVLEDLIDKNGGAYRTSGRDSVFFQLYTNTEFAPLSPPEASRKGVSVTLAIDTPPGGAARDKDVWKRVEYWEHSKRLQGASLVALLIVANGTLEVYLGVITSYSKDIAESAKHEQGRIQVRVSFFDAEVELMAMRGERLCTGKSNFAVLVDNGVMFESVRPFLHKLQTIEPTEIPFSRYIAPGGSLERVDVPPPKYGLVPGFRFDLQCLAKPGESITPLDVLNPLAVRRAREQLIRSSILDPSQADAVVDTLAREVSLIQGPPGTGKSFTAKEILRVLFANSIKPIVLIAYTNHALDHMLTSVLDAGITEKVVRLGTRSSDERIAQYTLDKLEKLADASTFNRSMNQQYAIMKQCEERLTNTMASIRLPLASWEEIEEFIGTYHADLYDSIQTPPFWIAELARLKWEDEDLEGQFEEVRRKGKKKWSVNKPGHRTMYGVWREGIDIHFLQQTSPASSKPRKGNQGGYDRSRNGFLLANPHKFFASLKLGYQDRIPLVPRTNRPLDKLLASSNVWTMSLAERARLADEWEEDIRAQAYESQLEYYTDMKQEYKEECQINDDMRDEARRRLLSQTDLIACTTTGAASLTSLLSSIAPKVLMVEEAGQVLEAHILTSLVSSVRHLICIGDPKQLRPTMATFALSMDSGIGKDLYKFDRSLMERLSDAGYPMSQINVQRRMRPTISHFIRTILYPKLQDHQVVTQYPPVQGMQSDVFFLNHLNKENGTEDSVSKVNMYEVDMIRDLVVYFLRQGTYNGPGDIAVLCAYLGQLQKVRAVLRDLKIAVAVDERDAEQLARQGLDEDSEVEMEEVLVAKHVRLGTVDIFQGQEAKIVIVSLVRNSGQPETGTIGFLKSPNRINVALSRAKHGLYIFGNVANLRQNPTWSTILDDMENRGQIGSALPIICPRHPKEAHMVSKPGELPLYAPAGGCVLPCGAQLACGHICPSACHAVLDNHRSVKCMEPCPRTPCPRQHPCSKRCSDDCGKCMFPVYSVALPCGHTASKAFCYQLDDLATVKCSVQVRKELPGCEHSAIMACFRDPNLVSCLEPCGRTLQCCSTMCKASCSGCRSLTLQRTQPSSSSGKVSRTHHVGHPCERLLPCQHACGLGCVKGHACNTVCRQPCRQRCPHNECSESCSEPCAPCREPCKWSCAHFTCPLPCGSICSRVPCDEPCTKSLKCGHPCPSVCGEPCVQQECPVCLPSENKTDIVDLTKQRRLKDIDLESTDISDRLVTLACGHTFTIPTLDRHCGMQEYYDIDPMGRFLAPKSPPVSYRTPPTCPMCHGPITALRYGRITKRAALDILEQNIVRTRSAAIGELSPSVSSYMSKLSDYREQAREIAADTASFVKAKTPAQQTVSFKQSGPLPETAFDLDGMQRVHGLALEEARAWYQVVKDVVNTYRRVLKLANARGPHINMYEAALSILLRIEMQNKDHIRATDTSDPITRTQSIVDRKIGQTRPQAEVPFRIEAYFLSLELRSLLAQIAQSRVEGLSKTSNDPSVARHRELWTTFVSFLYDSCMADAVKAITLATRDCSAPRQATCAEVHKLRFWFEGLKWRLLCEHAELLRTGALNKVARERLLRRATDYRRGFAEGLEFIEQSHRIRTQTSQTSTTEHSTEVRRWLDENCRAKVEALEREGTKLEALFLDRVGVDQRVVVPKREDPVKRQPSSSDTASGLTDKCIVA